LGSGFSSAVAGVETESAIGSLCGVESVEPIAVDSLNLLMEVCSGKGELKLRNCDQARAAVWRDRTLDMHGEIDVVQSFRSDRPCICM
jgi:hypothetical protein